MREENWCIHGTLPPLAPCRFFRGRDFWQSGILKRYASDSTSSPCSPPPLIVLAGFKSIMQVSQTNSGFTGSKIKSQQVTYHSAAYVSRIFFLCSELKKRKRKRRNYKFGRHRLGHYISTSSPEFVMSKTRTK